MRSRRPNAEQQHAHGACGGDRRREYHPPSSSAGFPSAFSAMRTGSGLGLGAHPPCTRAPPFLLENGCVFQRLDRASRRGRPVTTASLKHRQAPAGLTSTTKV